MRRIAFLSLVAMAVLLIACDGGGSSGSLKYAPTVVPIKHLDFTGMDLTYKEVLHPPHADQYPAVVAEVNGKPITGEQLAGKQVGLETSRRQLSTPIPGVLFPERLQQQLQGVESTDPLEALIDEALEIEAAERLGLTSSHEEAVRLTREAENQSDAALALAPADQKAYFEEMLREQGLLGTDWTANPKIVEVYRVQRGLTVLRQKECELVSQTSVPNAATTGRYDCSKFLAEERKKGDIVYYVRWAD